MRANDFEAGDRIRVGDTETEVTDIGVSSGSLYLEYVCVGDCPVERHRIMDFAVRAWTESGHLERIEGVDA